MKEKDKYKRYADELKPITNCLGIKLASVEQILSVYPDEFLGMEFRDEKKHYRKLIKNILI
jgi:hypothetical protein